MPYPWHSGRCAVCNASLSDVAQNAKRRYCSARCRQQAYRDRHEAERREEHARERCVYLVGQLAETLADLAEARGATYPASLVAALDVVLACAGESSHTRGRDD